MEGNGNKTVLGIIGLLVVIGMGVGGYYLGWFLDKQAYEKKINELAGVNKVYNNETLGIKFSYPGDWSSAEYESKDGTVRIFTTGDKGVEFGYVAKLEQGNIYVCDEKEPNGNDRFTKKCTFVTGSPVFGRFEETVDGEKLWIITESGLGKYVSYEGDYFYYKNATQSDLTTLDKIMKSVVRK